MKAHEVQAVLDTMAQMIEAELALAECYEACARRLPCDQEFWRELAADERGHAQTLSRMADIVAAKPECCRPNPAFRPGAARLLTSYVRRRQGELERGEMPPANMMFVMRDIEGSLIERRVSDVADVADAEFCRLAAQLDEANQRHYALVVERIGALKLREDELTPVGAGC